MKTTLARVLGLLTLSLIPATATSVTVWQFNGPCTDCPGSGTGTLTEGGTAFTFSYSSAWISYTLSNAFVAVGSTPYLPGTPLPDLTNADVYIEGTGPVTSFGGTNGIYTNPLPVGTVTMPMYFFAQASGSWSTGSQLNSDFGDSHTWTSGQPSGVPEPSSFALIAGAVVAGGLARRRWKQ